MPDSAIRLFCFAHAGGGGVVFRPWRTAFAPDIEVCPVVLPGREATWAQPAHTRMDDLAADVLSRLRDRVDRPFALFGHSMGAAVAYELAVRLCADDVFPLRLFVSGRRPPHVPARQRSVHGLSEEDLLAYLRSLGGLPLEVLANRDLLAAFIPTIRADFQVNETYAAGVRLPIPVSAFAGADDPLVTRAELFAWRDLTAAGFRARVLPGDHFYLTEAAEDLHAAIGHDLAAIARTERV